MRPCIFIRGSVCLSVRLSSTRFQKIRKIACFRSLMILEPMGEYPGIFSYTHSRTRMHSHACADEINMIPRKSTHIPTRLRAHTHTHTHTYTHARAAEITEKRQPDAFDKQLQKGHKNTYTKEPPKLPRWPCRDDERQRKGHKCTTTHTHIQNRR